MKVKILPKIPLKPQLIFYINLNIYFWNYLKFNLCPYVYVNPQKQVRSMALKRSVTRKGRKVLAEGLSRVAVSMGGGGRGWSKRKRRQTCEEGNQNKAQGKGADTNETKIPVRNRGSGEYLATALQQNLESRGPRTYDAPSLIFESIAT